MIIIERCLYLLALCPSSALSFLFLPNSIRKNKSYIGSSFIGSPSTKSECLQIFPFPVGSTTFLLSSSSWLHQSLQSQEQEIPRQAHPQDQCPPGFLPLNSTNQVQPFRRRSPPLTPKVLTALDISKVMEQVALHAGTKRGRQGILAVVVDQEQPKKLEKFRFQGLSPAQSKQQRWAKDWSDERGFSRGRSCELNFAQTVDEARAEYDLVGQAALLLNEHTERTKQFENLTIPPLYGAGSGPFDTQNTFDTDDDEWLDLPVSDWTLEDILKADQIVKMLLRVYDWSMHISTQTWAPKLAEIGSCISASVLTELKEEIDSTVEIRRTKTAMDPRGRGSYVFRLNSDKYPVLRLLREKEAENLRNSARRNKEKSNKDLAELQEEIMNLETAIQVNLCSCIAKRRKDIDDGLSIVARLDMLLAKAAYGVVHSGVIPTVKSDGEIHVKGFCHPLLEAPVPIDLHISGSQRARALIISGSNAGGKTVAMKSFGLAAAFVKLGIPLPASETEEKNMRVDFFDEIHASVGDQQDILRGQSTFMGQLARYSELIAHIETHSSRSSSRLILLDEIGSGTDQNAGGAIAQAILEKLLSPAGVRIVATSHCPRLKTLSYGNPNFNCACVFLGNSEDGVYKIPTYMLQYGVIGDSNALDAATRCVPNLPEDVIERATSLLSEEDHDAAFLRTLGDSMRKQLKLAEDARTEAEDLRLSAAQCQSALRRLALAYERHFGILDQRLEQCYQQMKKQPDTFELLGELLSEVRTAKKYAKTQAELLCEQGLKFVPLGYDFSEGELVTIVSEGQWNGEMATVCLSKGDRSLTNLGPDDILVSPSLFQGTGEPFQEEKMGEKSVLVFKRSQLAIWDYESAFEDVSASEGPSTSVSDTKRRLTSVLASLGTDGRPKAERQPLEATSDKKFISSRERKSSRKKKGK